MTYIFLFLAFLSAISLFAIAGFTAGINHALHEHVIKTKDVDRAKVYGEHLGEKLRK